jgi:predicted ATPase
MSRKPFIEKLHLRNFKSIQDEIVTFSNPLILVGRNDSGKTNFLNALSFLSECMESPLRAVVERLGGFTQLSNIHNIGLDTSYEAHVYLRADFNLGRKQRGHYAFTLGFVPGSANDFDVQHEQCVVADASGQDIWFDRENGNFRTNVPGLGLLLDTQALAMPIVGGVQVFAPVLKSLAAMRVYAIEPEAIRHAQEQRSNGYLTRNGSNIIDVLQRLIKRDTSYLMRLQELLTPVSPNLTQLMLVSSYGERTALMFTQKATQNADTVFNASSMADGTLRALGMLVASMQEPMPPLIAFDEPELYLHPGALSTVSNLIQSAAERSQIVFTTHSPELLDTKWVGADNLRVVERELGATHILDLGTAPVRALQQHLAGAGELLRSNMFDAAPRHQNISVESLFDKLPV